MNENISLRSASISDAAAIRDIYAPYVEKTAITFEYEVPSVAEFSARIAHTMEKYPYIVALRGDKIAGYAYLSAFHQRAAYQWSAETSIYVAEEEKGGGIGKTLYAKLEEIAKAQHILNLNACICYPNDDSVAFHQRLGYKTNAHFTHSGYKCGQWWDMIWMEKMIGEHTENPVPLLPIQDIVVKF